MNIEEIQEIKTLIGCLDIDDIEPVNKYTANVLRKIINQYEQLQQENKQLNGAIQTYDILLKSNVEENKLLKERIEYLERSNDRREDTILEQRQEICDLEDNWNKLREIIRKKQDFYRNFKDNRYRKFLSELLNKMQELEQGSDGNE